MNSKDLSQLLDKNWRLSNLYSIQDKNRRVVTFTPNAAQEHFRANATNRNLILKSRQLGYCLDPGTRVLTADLQWVRIKDLLPGQEIVSVDEHTPGGRGKTRKMRVGVIEGVAEVQREAYRITFEDGRTVICTGKHPWLSRKVSTDCKWRRIEEDHPRERLKVGTKIRAITKVWGESTYEDGWFGGMIDGEGSMANFKKAASVLVCQRKGAVWDRVIRYLENNGIGYTVEPDDKMPIRKSKFGKVPCPKAVVGRMNYVFQVIGKCRPERFIKYRFWEGRALPGKRTGADWAVIKSIEKMGVQTMIDLQTSTKTYIAEGLVSHNTTFEAIDALDDVLFNLNFNALFIAHQKEEATKIFDNKIMFAWQNLDETIKRKSWVADTEKANLLKFDFISTKLKDKPFSSISVSTSGRSGTFTRVHISEFAKLCRTFPRKAEEIITGTFPSVPLDGRIDIETTADGDYGAFYDMFWDAWKRGEPRTPTDFKAHFYNWTWDKEEISKVSVASADFASLPDRFREIQAMHQLSSREILYYYYQWLALNKNWSRLQQEYPITPDEAFVSSGNKLFAPESIDRLIPREGTEQGDWTFYSQYQLTHRYGLGADVAEGVGGDSSAIVILDFTTMDVAAIYSSSAIAPDLFAYEIRDGANRYGMCISAVERNNHGHATLAKLKEIYPVEKIYTETNVDKKRDLQTDRLGWATTRASKPRLIYDLKLAIDEGTLNVCSKECIWEMRTYGKDDIQEVRPDPERTQHWDLLMALCLAWQMNAHSQHKTNYHKTVQGGVLPFYPELGI